LECFICEKDKTMKNIITILLNVILVQAIAQTPTITNLSPTSGPIGTTVTITGTNFSTTVSNNTIWFGGVKATVTSATATSLVVIVPAGATHAPIRVLVNGKIGESQIAFNVTFTNGGITSTSMATKVDFNSGNKPTSISLGDIDGDGKLDMAVTNYNSNSVSVYRNTITSGGISSSSFATKLDFVTGVTPSNIAIGDIDGDLKLDMAVTNDSSNTISLFKNTSTIGSISFASKIDYVTSNKPSGISIGDLDKDGKLDIAVTNYNSNTVSV
jgi:hypothetical protein